MGVGLYGEVLTKEDLDHMRMGGWASKVSKFKLVDEPIEDEGGVGLREEIEEPAHEFYQACKIFLSIKTNEKLANIRDLYNVPDDIELILPSSYQTADRPLIGSVGFHSLSMDSGLRLPFHFFFCDLLSQYRLVPT
ncbi:hypothetical protein Adt_39097 [Abeliophyllum distichum]|uniref:Uncharacterized protein n=1 Tax=Abeliophyllum distichum TaxID=126358 RepID=A0ABD1Q432_9LAMI